MQHMDGAAEFAETMRQECLGTRISRLHRVIARRYELALRPLGLSVPQMEILSYLVLHDAPARPTELAELLMAERSTVSRTLAALQERGWVRTASTSATGRAMSVAATADGAAALAAARRAWADAQADISERLGAAAAGTMDAWLDALT